MNKMNIDHTKVGTGRWSDTQKMSTGDTHTCNFVFRIRPAIAMAGQIMKHYI